MSAKRPPHSTSTPSSPESPTSSKPPLSPESLIPVLTSTSIVAPSVGRKKHTLTQLKKDLDQAVHTRGTHYTQITALIVYWEADTTGAKRDAASLEAVFADCFGITSTLHVMKSSDKIPAWNITQILRKLIADNHNPAKPVSSLFIFTYIGHGRMNNGQLQMCSGSGKFIQWATIHRELFDVIEDVAHMDVFGFLDCCYAGGARSQMERKVQILAAASEREMTRARTAGISFTQRFGNAVRRLKGSGVPKVTTAKIFDELEKTRPLDAPKAQLSHLGGIGPIALGFKSSSNNGPSLHATHLLSLPHTTRDKHVLLHLVLDGDSQIVTREFQKVIEMLPADMQASIVDAYETDASAIVLIRMNHFGWATLSAAVEFEMIGQVIGSSLIHRKMALQQVQASQQGYENISPSKRS